MAVHSQQKRPQGRSLNRPCNIQGGHTHHACPDTSGWHQRAAHCEKNERLGFSMDSDCVIAEKDSPQKSI